MTTLRHVALAIWFAGFICVQQVGTASAQVDPKFAAGYFVCIENNLEKINAASVSIAEGVDLALSVVCIEEAKMAAATFAATPNDAFIGISRQRKAAAFVALLEQETKKLLFEKRSGN
jgi:hypothetical protein